MRTIECVSADLFDTDAPAIVLPVDGPARQFQGRTVNEFKRRCENWEMVAKALEAGPPLPLGAIRAVAIPDFGSVSWVLLASTLAHLPDETGVARFRAYVSSCVAHAVRFARTRQLGTVSCGLLRGGWRLAPIDAIHAMVDGYERAREDVTLRVHVVEIETASTVAETLESLGFR